MLLAQLVWRPQHLVSDRIRNRPHTARGIWAPGRGAFREARGGLTVAERNRPHTVRGILAPGRGAFRKAMGRADGGRIRNRPHTARTILAWQERHFVRPGEGARWSNPKPPYTVQGILAWQATAAANNTGPNQGAILKSIPASPQRPWSPQRQPTTQAPTRGVF